MLVDRLQCGGGVVVRPVRYHLALKCGLAFARVESTVYAPVQRRPLDDGVSWRTLYQLFMCSTAYTLGLDQSCCLVFNVRIYEATRPTSRVVYLLLALKLLA